MTTKPTKLEIAEAIDAVSASPIEHDRNIKMLTKCKRPYLLFLADSLAEAATDPNWDVEAKRRNRPGHLTPAAVDHLVELVLLTAGEPRSRWGG